MYRSKYELCAGYKIPYPKMKVYIRKLKKAKAGEKKKSYTFKYLMEQKNPVSISIRTVHYSPLNQSSSINLYWYGYYVLVGLCCGLGEPVL